MDLGVLLQLFRGLSFDVGEGGWKLWTSDLPLSKVPVYRIRRGAFKLILTLEQYVSIVHALDLSVAAAVKNRALRGLVLETRVVATPPP